jgi:signal transduction histidine kinase
VTVRTSIKTGDDDRRRVRIEIADTGEGMSEERRARIFDDFYTTKKSGTGLGLSIVRRLVMDLDGTINVESVEGEGSRFLVDLPGMSGNEREGRRIDDTVGGSPPSSKEETE